MILSKIKLSLIGIVLLVSSLTVLNAQEENDLREFHSQLYADQQKISHYIKQSVNDIIAGEPVEIEGGLIHSKVVLPEFYKNRDFKPAWDDYDALVDAVKGLEASYEDGLDPNDYLASEITAILNRLEEQLSRGEIDYDWVAEFDMLLTDAVMLYAYHLIAGKVDPVSLDANWNYSFGEVKPDAPYKLEMYIEQAEVSKALEGLRPTNLMYAQSMALLAKFRVIDDMGGWGYIEPGGAIKPGMEDKRVPDIRKRLSITGELSENINMSSPVYDSLLVGDIKRFQKRNALDDDGIIGKGTFEALNISAKDKIDILRVNMERNRWIMNNIKDNYILVNIAAFRAYYFRGGKLVFDTRVQVGKTYHKTPVFRERLRYIELNPTWTVPVSIVRSSILPKFQEDENYLDNNHYELIDASGSIVPNSSVDNSKVSASNFPYTVRQKAGPWNALGIVKFIFPNKHAVYLHDTPSKSLFDRQDRAFSHGCIRTQNPLDLAEVLMEGSEWDRKKIDQVIESKVTTRVFPEKEIDVMIMYWTAGHYKGDGIGFFRDIYGRDAGVLKKLNSRDERAPGDGKL